MVIGGSNEEKKPKKQEDGNRMSDGRDDQSWGRKEIFIMRPTASGRRGDVTVWLMAAGVR
jgi:hypothetical protein